MNNYLKNMGSRRKAVQLRPLWAIVIIATLIICTSMVFGYYFNLYQLKTPKEVNEKTCEENEENISRNTHKEINRNKLEETESYYYEFINRSEYKALPPKNSIKPLITPINRVIIAHTVTANCTAFNQCSNIVRLIQNYHMTDRKFDDIALNFLVGGDGKAYEGRSYHVGAHTKGYNFDSICIAFIGNFEEYEAPKRQLLAAQRIIEDGIAAKNIVPEYTLLGQIQLNGFSSPGKRLYNQIQSWSRWSNVTYISQQRRSKVSGTKQKKIRGRIG